MKTKEKEIQKKIKELCELMGKNDRFILFRKRGNVVDIALPDKNGVVNDNHISASLASTIEAHLIGNDNEGISRFSEIILAAIEALIGVSPVAGIKIASRLAKASVLGLKMTTDKLHNDDNDQFEEVSDCEGCELVNTCNEEDAVKYRKEHGIPKPKKGGRKVNVN